MISMFERSRTVRASATGVGNKQRCHEIPQVGEITNASKSSPFKSAWSDYYIIIII
jgi:hypothetical protein